MMNISSKYDDYRNTVLIHTFLDTLNMFTTLPYEDVMAFKKYLWNTSPSEIYTLFYPTGSLMPDMPCPDTEVDVVEYLEYYGRQGYEYLVSCGYFREWPESLRDVPRSVILAYVLTTGENRSDIEEFYIPGNYPEEYINKVLSVQ